MNTPTPPPPRRSTGMPPIGQRHNELRDTPTGPDWDPGYDRVPPGQLPTLDRHITPASTHVPPAAPTPGHDVGEDPAAPPTISQPAKDAHIEVYETNMWHQGLLLEQVRTGAEPWRFHVVYLVPTAHGNELIENWVDHAHIRPRH